MTAQILVVLKRNEQVEEILPYVEKIAQPGMKVVFLSRYPVAGDFLWLRDHWITAESTSEAILAGRSVVEQYSWEVQRALAEQKVSAARKALRKKGIEVAIDIYAGSVSRLVRDYAVGEDVQLIMMGAGHGHPVARLLRRAAAFFGLFGEHSAAPVLLFSPRRA